MSQPEKEPLLDSDFYDLEDLAKQLDVGIHYLYQEIKRGKLTAYKFGKSYKVTRADAREYVESKKTKPDDVSPDEE